MTDRLRACLLLALASFVLVVGASAPASAADKKAADTKKTNTTEKAKPQDISSSITQSYSAESSVQIGMLVQLKPKEPTTVIPLDSKNAKNLLGVVIPEANATIVLSPAVTQKQQVLVTNSGHYSVLVSNQNGPVKVGDYLAVSALDGIAMKASDAQPQVIGKAAGDFGGTANVIGTVKLKDALGKDVAVSFSRIPVDISVAFNPLFGKKSDNVPGVLSKIAIGVANKPVSAARIYLGLTIIIVTAIVSGNVLFSGVRSGMVAVGRNPLSKKSIIKSLIQTVIAGLIIFIVGIFGVYLLLKL